MASRQHYDALAGELARADEKVEAARRTLLARRDERAAILAQLQAQTPVVPAGFTVLLAHFAALGGKPNEAALIFALSEREMESVFLTYMQRVTSQVMHYLPHEPDLAKLAKRLLLLLEEEDQGIPKTQSACWLAHPFLNYCNAGKKYDEAHRNVARGLNNFCHVLEPGWGVGWFWHGIRELSQYIPDYDQYAHQTITSLLHAASEVTFDLDVRATA